MQLQNSIVPSARAFVQEYIIEPYNDTEGAVDVNRTYVLWDFGIIGEIKWDLRYLFRAPDPVVFGVAENIQITKRSTLIRADTVESLKFGCFGDVVDFRPTMTDQKNKQFET